MSTSFVRETFVYASRIRDFDKNDWLTYFAWVGLMSGLLFVNFGFVGFAYVNQVRFPTYVWNVPIGTAIFVGAISFDTIGHRTIYKEELKKGEALVHHITIFAGISSCILLSMAYHWREFLYLPSLVMVLLSIFYSVIDEALHWRRYLNGFSDRVEMWSHFFIFVGHLLMILSWWYWFVEGYPGVHETMAHLEKVSIF